MTTEDSTDSAPEDTGSAQDKPAQAAERKSRKATFLAAGAFTLAAIGAISDIGGVRDMAMDLFGQGYDLSEPASISLTLEDYEDGQKELLQTLTEEIRALTGDERERLQAELREVQGRLADLEGAYATRVSELRELQFRLADARGLLPETRLAKAQDLLAMGETDLAKQVFEEIEEASQAQIEIAAEAAYAQGIIERDNRNHIAAAAHFSRAASLQPTVQRLGAAVNAAVAVGAYDQALMLGEDLIRVVGDEGSRQDRIAALYYQGNTLLKVGRLDEAAAQFWAAINIALDQDATSVEPVVGQIASALGVLIEQQGDPVEAEQMHLLAVSILKDAYGQWHPEYAASLNNLGMLAQNTSRVQEAERLYGHALAVATRTYGERSDAYITYLANHAAALHDLGRTDEAIIGMRRSIELHAELFGSNTLDRAIRLSNLAQMLAAQGNATEAEALLNESLAVQLRTTGKWHPQYATTSSNLGLVLISTQAYAEAEKLFENAIEVDLRTIGDEHPLYGVRLTNLGHAQALQGNVASARANFEAARTVFQQAYPAGHPHLAIVEDHLAKLP